MIGRIKAALKFVTVYLAPIALLLSVIIYADSASDIIQRIFNRNKPKVIVWSETYDNKAEEAYEFIEKMMDSFMPSVDMLVDKWRNDPESVEDLVKAFGYTNELTEKDFIVPKEEIEKWEVERSRIKAWMNLFLKPMIMSRIEHPYERNEIHIRSMQNKTIRNLLISATNYNGFLGVDLNSHQLSAQLLKDYEESAVYGKNSNTISLTIPEIRPYNTVILTLKAEKAKKARLSVLVEDDEGRQLPGRFQKYSDYSAEQKEKKDNIRDVSIIMMAVVMVGGTIGMWWKVRRLEESSKRRQNRISTQQGHSA